MIQLHIYFLLRLHPEIILYLLQKEPLKLLIPLYNTSIFSMIIYKPVFKGLKAL